MGYCQDACLNWFAFAGKQAWKMMDDLSVEIRVLCDDFLKHTYQLPDILSILMHMCGCSKQFGLSTNAHDMKSLGQYREDKCVVQSRHTYPIQHRFMGYHMIEKTINALWCDVCMMEVGGEW
jgi:hypothetical protein